MRIALMLGGMVAGFFVLPPDQPATVPYPDGFREWTHVKSGLIGPQSEQFAGLGGLHHVYANPAARRALTDGRWTDGSIIVLDRFEAIEAGGTTKEGKRISLDVMVRDRVRYASTGGWGFERFQGDTRTGLAGANAEKACYQCHAAQAGDRMVFNAWRP